MLKGGGGDDILIGGRTLYDMDPNAVCALMEEWGRTDNTYADRMNHVMFGSGPSGLNGPYYLNGHIFDDYAVDDLYGELGVDWFLFHANDRVNDWTAGETKTLL